MLILCKPLSQLISLLVYVSLYPLECMLSVSKDCLFCYLLISPTLRTIPGALQVFSKFLLRD